MIRKDKILTNSDIILEYRIVSLEKGSVWAINPPTSAEQTKNYSFVKGQRGAPKMIYDGYSYICAKQINEKKYWVCGKQRSKKCKARLISDKDGKLQVTKNAIYHNHPPESSTTARHCIIESVEHLKLEPVVTATE